MRGFDATYGVNTSDKITCRSFLTPTTITILGSYKRHGLGGLSTGRLLDKAGVASGEITWRTSNTGAAMRFVRQFSTLAGIWEINDSEATAADKVVYYAITHDAGSTANDPRIWINERVVSGSFSSKTAPTGTVTNGTDVLCIGDMKAGGRNWDGASGDHTIYNVILTDQEIMAWFKGMDPRLIRPTAIEECVDLKSGFPFSWRTGTSLTIAGTKIHPDQPRAVNDNGVFPFGKAPAAAQTLTPSLFTNANTFFAPTVSAGAVGLTPGLFTNSNSFPAPTVLSSYGLTAGLFSNPNTFFAPTVSPGAVNLAPSLFTNSNIFYAPTVSTDGATQDLTPSLFSNSNTFFGPTVSASYDITPSLFTDSNSFFSPTVQATYDLISSLFGNTNAFYGPTVQPGPVDIAPPLVANDNVFYAPSINAAAQSLVASLFANSSEVYAPSVTSYSYQSTRLTGARPSSRASSLRTNLSTGSRPAAVSRG